MPITNSGHKVAIIGAGNVGAAAAYALTLKNIAAQVLLIDMNEKKEAGEVMDIADGLCYVDTGCVQGASFADARDADVIVITAGSRQGPDETRLDLVTKNKAVMRSIFKNIGKLKQTAVIVVVSNPVDVITYFIQELVSLPHGQIFGSGTALDTARLRTKIAARLGVSAQNIHGYVLGEHGDSEFVAWSTVNAAGIPMPSLPEIAKNKTAIETAVRREAYEIIERKGATYFGIGMVITDIVQAVLLDQRVILPVSARLKDWNGVSDVCLGAPAIIGRSGVLGHWPVQLTKAEQKKLTASAGVIKPLL